MRKKNLSLIIGHWSFPPKQGGFTFIEVMIVMSILGILAGLMLVAYPASQRRARDARRKSDLRQYQNALEVNANKKGGLYPRRTSGTGVIAHVTLCGDLLYPAGSCPRDVKDNDATACNNNRCRYYYQSNDPGCGGGESCATQYVLWAALEQPLGDDYWAICSNGKAGEADEVDIPPLAGGCPI